MPKCSLNKPRIMLRLKMHYRITYLEAQKREPSDYSSVGSRRQSNGGAEGI